MTTLSEYTESMLSVGGFVAILIGMFIVIFIATMLSLDSEVVPSIFISSAVTIILALLLIFVGGVFKEYKFKKVTFDETIPREIVEQYEIIDQDGLIFTIREKD